MSPHGFWKPAPVLAQQQQQQNVFREEGTASEEAAAMIFPTTAPPSSASSLQQQRRLLPIYKHRRQILYAVEHYSVVVIVGETGTGKSTQIPAFLASSLENGGGGGWAQNNFQIVCTEPRRLAAITLAQRVAQEQQQERDGIQVGYTVRFDDQTGPETQIKYVTDGMLLQEAVSSGSSGVGGDPLLSRYSVVMVDEAHERTLNSDALLGLLHKIRRRRPGLRLVICSATIDATRFLEFFVGKRNGVTQNNQNNSSSKQKDFLSTGTIISVDGRQHPVDVFYLQQPAPDYLVAAIETAWKIHSTYDNDIVAEQQGDALCFLPSGEDIDRAIRMAEEYFDQQYEQRQQEREHATTGGGGGGRKRGNKDMPSVEFLPLYGSLPYQMQARIFQDPQNKHGRNRKSKGTGARGRVRRVIFATNIAETSVSVPGVQYVIDSGLVKLPYFDPVAGLERLLVGPISQASAQQRTGRAGRICAGKCYRLYTEQYLHDQMQAHTPPEILRTNLTGFILTLKSLGVDNILAFELMDIPTIEALQHGLESLYALGAIDDKTNITSDGMDMAAFPVEPRVSRMLLESLAEGCSWEVLAVASALQVRELFHKPRAHRRQQTLDYETAMSEIADPSGDHVTYANLFAAMDDRDMEEDECREKFVNYVALRRGLEVRSQLARFLRRFGRVQAIGLRGDESHRSKAIRRCVVAGFFFNVAKLGNDGRYYTLRSQVLVTPSSSSVLTTHSQISSEYIVFGETIDGPRGGIELKSVSAIEAKWLRELAPHYWE